MIGGGNWAHVIQALRYRDHRLFNTTLAPAVVSLWAQRTGIGWLAWDLTHSPTWLGIVAAADLLPGVVLSPFAGVTADRSVPLKMMRITQGIIMVHALVLWALTASGLINIWILFAFALITGFNQPYATAGRMVFFPVLVPREELGTAIAINSTVFNAGRAVGPALAGLMIAPLGVASVFLFNFATYFAHLINLFRIHPMRTERHERLRTGMLSEIKEGLSYTVRHPGIGPMLLLMAVVTVASRPLIEMLPGFADEVFHRGAEALGWMMAAIGIGCVAGAIWLTRRGPVTGLTTIVLTTTLLMGIATVAFSLIGDFFVGLAILGGVGFAHTIFGTGTQSLMQTAVAAEVRGRVMSLYTVIFRSMPAVGAIAVGIIAEFLSLPVTVAGAGAICVLAWAAARPRRKAIEHALEAHPGSA